MARIALIELEKLWITSPTVDNVTQSLATHIPLSNRSITTHVPLISLLSHNPVCNKN